MTIFKSLGYLFTTIFFANILAGCAQGNTSIRQQKQFSPDIKEQRLQGNFSGSDWIFGGGRYDYVDGGSAIRLTLWSLDNDETIEDPCQYDETYQQRYMTLNLPATDTETEYTASDDALGGFVSLWDTTEEVPKEIRLSEGVIRVVEINQKKQYLTGYLHLSNFVAGGSTDLNGFFELHNCQDL